MTAPYQNSFKIAHGRYHKYAWFGPSYKQYFLQRKCRPQYVVFNDILFIAIFAGVTENECVTEIEAKLPSTISVTF